MEGIEETEDKTASNKKQATTAGQTMNKKKATSRQQTRASDRRQARAANPARTEEAAASSLANDPYKTLQGMHEGSSTPHDPVPTLRRKHH